VMKPTDDERLQVIDELLRQKPALDSISAMQAAEHSVVIAAALSALSTAVAMLLIEQVAVGKTSIDPRQLKLFDE